MIHFDVFFGEDLCCFSDLFFFETPLALDVFLACVLMVDLERCSRVCFLGAFGRSV